MAPKGNRITGCPCRGSTFFESDVSAPGISRAFTFNESDLISGPVEKGDEETDVPVFRFRFATRTGGYFRIAGRILGISNDVLIADQGITLERKLFVAERNVGIFRRVAKVKPGIKDPNHQVPLVFLSRS